MPDPVIPPEAEDPSGRTPDSLPTMAPNPSKADPDRDPTDADTAPPGPIDPAI